MDFYTIWQKCYKKASNHVLLYFPPHLINASTLPCENENTEIVSFHLNAAC